MNRFFIILVFVFCSLLSLGQDTYFTRNGHIYFISKTDAIDIDANNYQVASFFDINAGKLQFAVLIKSFEFTLATAKEHFNEEYMESDKYPKATFKGEVVNFSTLNITKDSSLLVMVKGEIKIKGITKAIEVPGQIIIQNKRISATSEFNLSISDFGIKVPKLLEHRVANQILVKVDMNFEPYKK